MLNEETYMVESAPTFVEGVRFLHNKYRGNKERFLNRFLYPTDTWLQMVGDMNRESIIDIYKKLWDVNKPYSYSEAFEIADEAFRAMVFSVIDVPEMIKELGSTRIKTTGVELTNKVYDPILREFKDEDFTQIYELHLVNGTKLNLNEDVYAIKCWCTSTNDEHWLWVDSEIGVKEDPLTAIASTCKVYSSMVGKIRHIIRQGDVFLFEMESEVIPNPNEDVVSLDAETYFKLLKSQS